MSDGDLPEPFGSQFDAAAAQHGRPDDEWLADVRARVDGIRRRRLTIAAVAGVVVVIIILTVLAL